MLLLSAALKKELHQTGSQEGVGVVGRTDFFNSISNQVFLLSVFHLVALWHRIFKCEEVSLAQIQPIL